MQALRPPPHVARRTLLAGVGSLLVSPAIVRAQGQGNGVALVIGNSKYKWEASLPNVRRDAPDLARRFQGLGLKTELLQDVGRDAMLSAVEKFKASASGANLAAFYFAGHGASWGKDTYLVPVDADLGSPEVVRTLLPVRAISAAMQGASHRLLVFDNCRNNPADGWRQKEALNASIVAAADQIEASLQEASTLTLFSTAPGHIALDGPPGQNSPFAAALLRQFDDQSIDLMALPAGLRRDLLISTECRQVLWDVNTFRQPFVMNGSGIRQASSAPPHDASREVPLTNAYAFARQSGLILPAGLIANRALSGAQGSKKVGSFKFEIRMSVGTSGQSIEPSLLIVMAENDAGTAESIVATKEWNTSKGSRWRFVTTKLAADELEFFNIAETERITFHWRDRDSGTFSQHTVGSGGGRATNGRFARLDG